MISQQKDFANKCYQIDQDILYRQIEDEAVLLHTSSGMYYSLNVISMRAWEALQNNQSLDTFVDKVLEEFNVERAQVLKDLDVFINTLTKFGLIVEISHEGSISK